MSSTLPPGHARRRHRRWTASLAVLMAFALAGCATAPNKAAAGTSGGSGVINVVAAENFWGSLAEQLGGNHVKVTSLKNSPTL